MTGTRVYGVSTHLFHGEQLGRDHLRDIAAARFSAIELVTTRSHFDCHHDQNVANLQQWLAEAGLTLASVHAPISEGFHGGRHTGPLLLAAADASRRAHAVSEVERAIHIARRIPYRTLTVHIGSPRPATDEHRSSRDGAKRSLETLQKVAAPLGVRLAVEVAQNDLSAPHALVHFLTDVLDAGDVGVCLDLGHAHLTGDLADAVETVSEYLLAVDVHDNRGRTDEHLMPFEGTIDWPAALTTLQKVGYDGPLMFELTRRGAARDTLAQARQARQQMDRLLAD